MLTHAQQTIRIAARQSLRDALAIILADAQILRWIAEGYDREDAAMIGEPDPWALDDAGDIGDAETWQAERIGCARAGLRHAAARLASDALQLADDEWQRQLEATFGRHAGDARYDKRGQGEPATPLRRAYENREAARRAWESVWILEWKEYYG
jgi:hypothetical protein